MSLREQALNMKSQFDQMQFLVVNLINMESKQKNLCHSSNFYWKRVWRIYLAETPVQTRTVLQNFISANFYVALFYKLSNENLIILFKYTFLIQF